MLVKGDWVVQARNDIDGATKRDIRRLNRRTEEYSPKLVFWLMLPAGEVLLCLLNYDKDTVLQFSLLGIFILLMAVVMYVVLAPMERLKLRYKLHQDWKLFPSTDVAYQMIMIEPIVQATTNEKVEYHVSRFLQSMRYQQLTDKDELWFLNPEREVTWNILGDYRYAAVLSDCEDLLMDNISEIIRPLLSKKLVEVREELMHQGDRLQVLHARHDYYIAKLSAS